MALAFHIPTAHADSCSSWLAAAEQVCLYIQTTWNWFCHFISFFFPALFEREHEKGGSYVSTEAKRYLTDLHQRQK